MLQELLERYLHDGHVHWELFVSAPFLFGLATQVPFALLAAAIAFALASAAQRVAHVLRRVLGRRPRPIAVTFLSWLSIDPPVERVLARGYAGPRPSAPRLAEQERPSPAADHERGEMHDHPGRRSCRPVLVAVAAILVALVLVPAGRCARAADHN